jgi:hypothetical protein
MKNKTLMTFDSDLDFSNFINIRFKYPVQTTSFPDEYEKRRPPLSQIKETSNPEVQNIIERELIRDNIYTKYKFDIYEYPFVVFYENEKSKELLKPFKKIEEANKYCSELLNHNIYSLLILIMNHNIECHLFSNKGNF